MQATNRGGAGKEGGQSCDSGWELRQSGGREQRRESIVNGMEAKEEEEEERSNCHLRAFASVRGNAGAIVVAPSQDLVNALAPFRLFQGGTNTSRKKGAIEGRVNKRRKNLSGRRKGTATLASLSKSYC